MKMKREIEIMSYLKTHGVVHIQELSRFLKVSKNTVRRDLKSLEDQGLLEMKRGGAALPNEMNLGISLSEREIQNIDEKRRIGECANRLIPDKASVILDAGTTTEQIALAIKNRKGLTVITNALNILIHLADEKEITSVSIGGVINPVTRCFTGFHAEQFLSQFHVAVAFVSAGGVTEQGVTNTNALEVPIKRKMLEIADKVILVVTHDKFGKKSLSQFASLDQIDVIITDAQADPKMVQRFESMGIEVMLC